MSTSKPRTPRTENRFREREVARFVRAAKRAGSERVELDPTTGRMTAFLGKPEQDAMPGAEAWDKATENLRRKKQEP